MTGFVWHELMSTDVEQARALFANLFGWRCEDGLLNAGEHAIASVLPFVDPGGVGSHWVPYVESADLDATCREATMCIPPTEHALGGRFAFLTDPQGAFFCAWQGGRAARRTGATGTFWRDKLLAADVARARSFYGAAAWIVERPPIAPRSMWLPHVIVDDVAATSRRAMTLGTMIVVPPKQLAGVGTYCVLVHSAGGIVAAIAPEERHAA